MAKQTKIDVKSLLLLTLISATLALSSSSKYNRADYHNYPPPGCIEVVDGLFYDQTECANVHWREYMFWTELVFGKFSKEHLATFPDIEIWKKLDIELNKTLPSYFQHTKSEFNFFPIVGISQEQAEQYSKWRSDRVFEMILVRRGIIKHDTAQTAETYFTIEKFFNKELSNILKGEPIEYIPEYRLPTIEERKKLMQHVDSLKAISLKNRNSGKWLKCVQSKLSIWMDINLADYDFEKELPFRSIISGCDALKKVSFYNLRGNVGEWLFEPNISAGGGWIDNKEYFQQQDTISTLGPNAWTGFRNVFEWKKWEGCSNRNSSDN